MPLSQDELEEVSKSFEILDVDKKGYLTKEQVHSLFTDLKINLPDRSSKMIIDGMMCGKNKATLSACSGAVALIHDQDELGILKICFRGIDKTFSGCLTSEEGSWIAEALEKNITAQDLKEKNNNEEDRSFTFAMLAKFILDIDLPADADPFNGVEKQSSCCLLI